MTKDYSYRKSPCVVCGQPRWTTKGSLLEGRCGACRRAARIAKDEQVEAQRVKSCAWCGDAFDSHWGSKYCSPICREVGSRAKSRERKKFYPKTQTSTERGYGTPHRRARTELLADFTPGTPCGFCDEPMFEDQLLDLDHSDPAARLRQEPGDRLTHRSCNRRDGARRARLVKATAPA